MASLIYTGVLFCTVALSLAQHSHSPQLDASRDIGNLTEGDVLKLTCTFSLFSFLHMITVGQSSTDLTTDPGGVNVAGLDNVIAIAGAYDFQPQFSIEFTVNRKHDHLAFIFSQAIPVDTTYLLSSITRTLRVKYGPLKNISDSTAIYVNVSGIGLDESRLDASGLFEDPGNPTSTVQWTWDNGSRATGTISGMRNSMLSERVTRGDNGHAIVARYDNGIGYTMQRFTICAKSVPESPPTQCSRVATGYSCSWCLPADDGGYSVTHYDYGYMKGTSTTIQNLTRVTESTTSAINANLEPTTTYTFVVSAVNGLGSGPRGSDSVVTPSLPGAVVDVDTMPLLRFSLKVKWTPPAGEDKEFPVTLYHVSLYTVVQDSEALETKFANSTMNEAVFFDLKDNTTYRFRVAAENAVGKGPYSEYVLGNTFPNGTVGVVSAIPIREESSNSFLIEWTAEDAGSFNFEITGYRVEILLDGMVVQNVDIPGKDQTSRVISGLQPETTYEIRVYARNRDGEGRPSSVVSATTTKAKTKDENIGPIVGVVVGVIAVVITGVIFVYFCYKKKPDVSDKETSGKPRSTIKTMHTENPSSEPPPTGEHALLGAAIPEANKPGGKQPGQVTYAQLDLEINQEV